MNLKNGIISLILGILGSLIAGLYQPLFTENALQLITLIAFTSLMIFLFIQFIPTIKSYVRMYFVGRFRGLWSTADLSNLIQREYAKSDEIKIKVTRGFGLFYEKNGVFNKCIFENNYNDRKMVKVLLHYPCLKSDHIQRRASTNQKSPESYIEDLFKVLKLFKDHNLKPSSNEMIFVRFYNSDEEKEWRFYVFKQKDESKVLLFNHYDDHTTGSKSRMLKVIGGNNSLCEELNKEFDKLYDDYSVELVENLQSSNLLKNQNFCGHPSCKQKIEEIHKKTFN